MKSKEKENSHSRSRWKDTSGFLRSGSLRGIKWCSGSSLHFFRFDKVHTANRKDIHLGAKPELFFKRKHTHKKNKFLSTIFCAKPNVIKPVCVYILDLGVCLQRSRKVLPMRSAHSANLSVLRNVWKYIHENNTLVGGRRESSRGGAG